MLIIPVVVSFTVTCSLPSCVMKRSVSVKFGRVSMGRSCRGNACRRWSGGAGLSEGPGLEREIQESWSPEVSAGLGLLL